MAPTSQYLSSADLKAVNDGGLIREDVMDQIWDISKIPLPYTDLVGSDSCDNAYFEWTTDKLSDPEIGGWVVDGADSDKNDSSTGARLGNHCGILDKEVQVTGRARASDTIGRGDELSYQVMMRQRELRRNVEANALGIQGSQEDDGDATPGIPAGLAAMVTQFDTGSGAAGGGFAAKAWTEITPGARVPLTETMVRDAQQDAYLDGADPTVLMSVPGVIRKLSEYMFTSSSRIATLTRETQGITGGGSATAVGSVNVFITDFGQTLTFRDNRIQQIYEDSAAAAAAAVFLLDPAYARITFLRGYRVNPLAKTGDADKRQMLVDWSNRVMNPDAHRVLLDIDPTAAVTFDGA
ncbi:SU10 major capsid protein [Qingshengfaniella alkalisoli]|uniref:Uncharacterized protein n=1 Tax=Qingshengfaniella alkalisoli TaxID=2599296 RepID=A0A5B8IX10_9RHOB|nr:DUF5309 family protein [Qingshengfaniella alkalisoli]QDY70123.1 hypothetical protein FPZ52_11155 [Qingshengfaniella alkalisoli]